MMMADGPGGSVEDSNCAGLRCICAGSRSVPIISPGFQLNSMEYNFMEYNFMEYNSMEYNSMEYKRDD